MSTDGDREMRNILNLEHTNKNNNINNSTPNENSSHHHSHSHHSREFYLLGAPVHRLPAGNTVTVQLLFCGFVLFIAFMAHDYLQESMFSVFDFRSPLAFTIVDFFGCAFFPYITLVYKHTQQQHTTLAHALRAPFIDLFTPNRHHHNNPLSSSSSSTSSVSAYLHAHTRFISAQILAALMVTSCLLAVLSLHYVSYPVKVVLRSCRLIPTMLIGVVLLRKQYKSLHYFSALCLCFGAIGFTLADDSSSSSSSSSSMTTTTAAATLSPLESSSSSSSSSSLLLLLYSFLSSFQLSPSGTVGLLLLTASTAIDSVNANVQEYFMKRSSAASSTPLSPTSVMFNTNLLGLPLLFLVGIMNGELWYIARALYIIPDAESEGSSSRSGMLPVYLALYGVCSYTGVTVYTTMIEHFGSATATAAGTLRKVFTILLSFLLIGRRSSEGLLVSKSFSSAFIAPSIAVIVGVMSASMAGGGHGHGHGHGHGQGHAHGHGQGQGHGHKHGHGHEHQKQEIESLISSTSSSTTTTSASSSSSSSSNLLVPSSSLSDVSDADGDEVDFQSRLRLQSQLQAQSQALSRLRLDNALSHHSDTLDHELSLSLSHRHSHDHEHDHDRTPAAEKAKSIDRDPEIQTQI